MTGKSKKYMLMGKLSYMFAAALVIASLITNLIPATTASAHHPIITGIVSCQVDGTKMVTWKIVNSEDPSNPMTITAIDPALTGVKVGVGDIVDDYVTGTSTYAGDDHNTVSLSVSGYWVLTNVSSSRSGSTDLGSNTCTPPDQLATASVTPGACSWSEAGGSQTPVTLSLTGASLTINGVTFTDSTSINLAPGSYDYSWTALSGYTGSGIGSVSIGKCVPPDASASVTPGACSWSEAGGSQTPVTLSLTGASLTINGITYTDSTSVNLAPGSYDYSWTALSGYKGSGSGSILVGDCKPGNATASVSTGACSWSEAGDSQTPVTLSLTSASLTINGITYTDSTSVNLAPGSYDYSWTAKPGFKGSGSGTLVVAECSANQIAICHATGDATAPYTLMTVYDVVGYDGHGDHAWDIIPAPDGGCPSGYLHDPLTKTASPVTYKQVGEVINYTYVVTNSGTITMTGVAVTDDKAVVDCLGITTLIPGASMTCHATYTITPADVNATFVSNVATSVSNETPPVTATATVNAVPFSNLVLGSRCTTNPDASNGWKVVNDNPYDVGFEYAIDGGVSGLGTVPANSTATFTTPVGSGTGVMSLYVGGIWQNNAKVATGCSNPPPQPPSTPESPVVSLVPLTSTAGGPTILIPVTGVDNGLLGRVLPRSLFGLSLSFAGLGLVLTGFARRREDE